jgi:hypothetical protein
VVFTALPAEGYGGEAPAYPLGPIAERTSELAERELAIWAEVWRSPQACVWALQHWRWMTVAHYVRLALKVECGGAAADINAMIRLSDQIGLSPAGLKENGWKIVEDQLAAKRQEKDGDDLVDDEDGMGDVRDRFKSVNDDDSGG